MIVIVTIVTIIVIIAIIAIAIVIDKYKNSNNNSNSMKGSCEEKPSTTINDDDDLNKELNNMNSHSNRNCLCCLKEVEGQSRCSKCRTALYCSRECQLEHWPVHKNMCIDSNTENSDAKLGMKATNHRQQGI